MGSACAWRAVCSSRQSRLKAPAVTNLRRIGAVRRERHCYLLHPDELGNREVAKGFYVSPFLGPEGEYRMSFPAPGAQLVARVALEQDGARVFAATLAARLMGMAHGVEAVLPGMRRRRRGVIVGVASLAGVRGFPRSEAYGASKAAQINLLESLRLDLQPLGIRVQTVCPGFVRTELTAANAFKMPFMLEPDDAARRIARGIERGSAEIAFPLPMAIGMRLARAGPAGAYAAAWRHRARKR